MSTPAPTQAKKSRARRTPGERATFELGRARGRVKRANDASVVADKALREAQAAKKAADDEVQAAEKAETWWLEHPDLPKRAGGAS